MFMRSQHLSKGLSRSYNSVDVDRARSCQRRTGELSKRRFVKEQTSTLVTASHKIVADVVGVKAPNKLISAPQKQRRIEVIKKPRAYY
jgi:hypothetical protein